MSSDSIVNIKETKREFCDKTGEPLRDVRLRKENPINSHFERKGHGPEALAFAVLEKVFGAERIEKQLREALWIKRSATARPDGCNVMSIC